MSYYGQWLGQAAGGWWGPVFEEQPPVVERPESGGFVSFPEPWYEIIRDGLPDHRRPADIRLELVAGARIAYEIGETPQPGEATTPKQPASRATRAGIALELWGGGIHIGTLDPAQPTPFKTEVAHGVPEFAGQIGAELELRGSALIEAELGIDAVRKRQQRALAALIAAGEL